MKLNVPSDSKGHLRMRVIIDLSCLRKPKQKNKNKTQKTAENKLPSRHNREIAQKLTKHKQWRATQCHHGDAGEQTHATW